MKGNAGKRFIAWARVSSIRQKDEGWSLEQQQQRLGEHAARLGGEIIKLYVVAETASKHQERRTFKEMMQFARDNSKTIAGVLVMKIDRAARNMRDFVALESLEEDHGVPLISVTQPTENTPSGRMMRRTFATFATFFTEQLSVDVTAALKRRAESGLFVCKAPFGYRNYRDEASGRRLVKVDQTESAAVQRIFTLYAHYPYTLDTLREQLAGEGVTYRTHQPRFTRSKLHSILTDRSYIGDVDHHGNWLPGKHEPIVDRQAWDRVQAKLGKPGRRDHSMVYAGNLITCGECGRPITGELKTKRTSIATHTYFYYRCARYNAPGHGRTRLREEQLDAQVKVYFERLRLADDERRLFVNILRDSNADADRAAVDRAGRIAEELKRVRSQRDALLNLRIAGEIEPDDYTRKATQLRDRESGLLSEGGAASSGGGVDLSLKAFELSQVLRETWDAGDSSLRRRILNLIGLNFTLNVATLAVEMRKPFDMIAEGLNLAAMSGRGDANRTFIDHILSLPPEIRESIDVLMEGRAA